MSLLEIENLGIGFPGNGMAVDGVSLAIKPGEILGLVGESGSGKSLTALSILKLLPSTAKVSGRVIFQGKEISSLPEKQLRKIRGAEISMIFQEPMTSLNPLHTIGRQIIEAILLHQSMPKTAALTRAKELLDLVGLKDFSNRLNAFPHQLSGGQRQRVMIAMALANNPKLLIADEPTTALDVTVQAAILALLQDLQKKIGMAVLLITHDLTVVKKIAGLVAVMQKGKIVETDSTEKIFAAPAHPYTQKLINSAPTANAGNFTAGKILVAANDINVDFIIGKKLFSKPKILHAVDSVSLNVGEGESVGIVGESGSGKSTLALALLKLVQAHGEIKFNNANISAFSYNQMRPYRKNMQIVFQDPYSSLNPRMSVAEILAEGLKAHEKFRTHDSGARIAQALADVGLSPEMQHRYPHEFSGGQRQRIAIARSLILNPQFLILDEPTSALDLTTQAEILELLKKLQREKNLSYLFISHDLRVIRSICHRVLVMKNGKVVEEGETENIFMRPENEYTKALVQAVA